ncbi:hypothetical protein M9H77_14072 [Catharanthus roseus]|uniref:Uncharacterized protein n=1 Tax=Catharanthus roseus TaxID=4058 RepID=A0ACC0BM88_CATRO|nr:hypothetical protein M9H77_14072 [Catharanthus roseus]
MYEVSQNVDLSLKVDAFSKKFDQLLTLNTLPSNSPNVQGVCVCIPHSSQSGNSMFEEKVSSALKGLEAMTQIVDSHTQPIARLEIQMGQLANAINRRDKGKLSGHPIENPRANHYEQVKAVITLRNGKLVDNKVGEPIKDGKFNENKTKGIDIGTKIERKIEKELASSFNSKTLESSPTASYKPKVPYPQALLPPPTS